MGRKTLYRSEDAGSDEFFDHTGSGTRAVTNRLRTPKWIKPRRSASEQMASVGAASTIARVSYSFRTGFRETIKSIWRSAVPVFLLGDGRLNYGREDIVKTYYTLHVWRGIYPAFGLQHINNPGYNRDRGPVIVPSLRLHLEF